MLRLSTTRFGWIKNLNSNCVVWQCNIANCFLFTTLSTRFDSTKIQLGIFWTGWTRDVGGTCAQHARMHTLHSHTLITHFIRLMSTIVCTKATYYIPKEYTILNFLNRLSLELSFFGSNKRATKHVWEAYFHTKIPQIIILIANLLVCLFCDVWIVWTISSAEDDDAEVVLVGMINANTLHWINGMWHEVALAQGNISKIISEKWASHSGKTIAKLKVIAGSRKFEISHFRYLFCGARKICSIIVHSATWFPLRKEKNANWAI